MSSIVFVDSGKKMVKFYDGKDFFSFISLQRKIQQIKHSICIQKEPIIVKWNGDMYIIGNDAAVYGAKPIMIDEHYIKDSILYYLVCIGKSIDNYDDNITLAITLSYNQKKYIGFLKENLKKKHVIYFRDGKNWIEKRFTIKNFIIQSQGLIALYRLIIDPEKMDLYEEYSDWSEKDIIIIDYGSYNSRTIEITVLQNLTPVDGISIKKSYYIIGFLESCFEKAR